MLNDAMQSVLNAVYPLIKKTLELDFGQIGKIALVYQISASIFQPLLGYYLDKKPNAWFLPIGMLFTMGGSWAWRIRRALKWRCARFSFRA